MRCTIPLQPFFHLVRACISLISPWSTTPITKYLLLQAGGEQITLTATNLETTVIAQCPASISEAGTVTLPGKTLFEILKELSGEEITLSHNNKGLETKLHCGGSRVQLIGMPAEEFPSIPAHTATPLFSLPQEHLHRLLNETIHSIGHETRNALNTLRIEWHPTSTPTIRLVATNGNRLTQAELTTGNWLTTPQEKGHALLARTTAQLLHRLLRDTNGHILTVGFADALLTLTLPTLQVTTRLVDSSYPDYETFTTRPLSPCLTFMRKACIDSLNRLAIIAPRDTPAIDLDLTTNGLIVRTDNPQLGYAREEVCATILREDFTIRLNAQYLLDALTTAPTDSITLNMDTPHSPCILTNETPGRWKAVIMPIRLHTTHPKNTA
jgi:DNA polymerase-3 subunit beta